MERCRLDPFAEPNGRAPPDSTVRLWILSGLVFSNSRLGPDAMIKGAVGWVMVVDGADVWTFGRGIDQ